MRIHSDLADTIGNTPLLKLKRASEMTGCTILGKCEFLNPGQSVKDRAALYIIKDAVAKGHLKPGGTIVEGTAGNTGIGLAFVAARAAPLRRPQAGHSGGLARRDSCPTWADPASSRPGVLSCEPGPRSC